MELSIISTNASKASEIKESLKELAPNLAIQTLFDFPSYTPPHDIAGEELMQRALRKAQHASVATQTVCLVEQWSLQIPSLQEEALKTIFSEPLQNSQIRAILLALKGKAHESERLAYLESHVAVFTPTGTHKLVTARLEGWIAEKEEGRSPRDFDSIFVKHDYKKTLAELTPSVRRQVSCRRKALERIASFLRSCTTL
jgi:non-canonical purine NTP pyrophosphatase (RdgB/HAM1 family)